jgi:galactose mutarotase-like enzyme
MSTPVILTPSGEAGARTACVGSEVTEEGLDAVRLCSRGDLEAVFAPQADMACCSLRHRGAELLGERFGLAAYASEGEGITMGMSLMHPWANRLASWSYTACGASVHLPVSRLLHRGDAAVRQLELFPFPHRLHLSTELTGRCVSIAIAIEATSAVPVPACFAYRFYLRREHTGCDTTMVLPARRLIATDARLLPTGATEPHEMSASTLGLDEVHEVFQLEADPCLSIASDARRLTVESLSGFPFVQVCSVAGEPHVMVEALTAAPGALSDGRLASHSASGPRHHDASLLSSAPHRRPHQPGGGAPTDSAASACPRSSPRPSFSRPTSETSQSAGASL